TPGEARRRKLTRPRPGHADLTGVLKYAREDARDILERASARETAARVAAGAVARRLLEELGIQVGSHVVSLGGLVATAPRTLPIPLNAASDASPVRMLDPKVEGEAIARIDRAKKDGDTLGGEVEVVVHGLMPGLGSHVHWDRKLDGRLAGILMSIPAVKGVEIGLGFTAARRPGSEVHDPIVAAPTDPAAGGYRRLSNHAGGLEGGMTTGEPLVVRVAMKPIATLMTPLATVDLTTGAAAQAQSERSDVTAVPAMGVIAEALVCLVLADAVLEKFGGDSLVELRRNVAGYLDQLRARWAALAGAPAEE
ncbi:MAG: chorismate synthase, partial [Gemmatimonadetes bacterium]|nr:chorismate synthase [Gemmatimonadota bacterium]